MTTVKPPLPTTTLENSRRLRRDMTDAARTRYLEAQGWMILRFCDHDALQEAEAVIDAIWNAIGKPDPHPNPSPDGRGAQAQS